jgi:hypothetical protein
MSCILIAYINKSTRTKAREGEKLYRVLRAQATLPYYTCLFHFLHFAALLSAPSAAPGATTNPFPPREWLRFHVHALNFSSLEGLAHPCEGEAHAVFDFLTFGGRRWCRGFSRNHLSTLGSLSVAARRESPAELSLPAHFVHARAKTTERRKEIWRWKMGFR